MKVSNIADLTYLKVPFIYMCTGLVWILAGNELLYSLTSNLSRETQQEYQSGKGIAYIVITTIMLFLLVKDQQKTLLRSEKQYRDMFADNPNPMMVFNIETKRIIQVNNAAIVKYGYSKREFSKMTMYDIRPDETRELFDQAIEKYKGRHQYSGRWIHQKKSGEKFAVSIISHKGNFNDQDSIMVLAIDVDELVKNEEKLEAAYSVEKELNGALRKIAWISSHEFRRPIASVLSLTELLGEVKGEEERLEYLNLLRASSKELDEVSRDIAGKINDIEKSCKLI